MTPNEKFLLKNPTQVQGIKNSSWIYSQLNALKCSTLKQERNINFLKVCDILNVLFLLEIGHRNFFLMLSLLVDEHKAVAKDWHMSEFDSPCRFLVLVCCCFEIL